jgi:IS4 transposase
LEQAEKITDHVRRLVFPAFSLDRGDGCEIHENAYWSLQTYLGLRERLTANEGARSFTYESTRERTPLGHAHRDKFVTSQLQRPGRCTDRQSGGF